MAPAAERTAATPRSRIAAPLLLAPQVTCHIPVEVVISVAEKAGEAIMRVYNSEVGRA